MFVFSSLPETGILFFAEKFISFQINSLLYIFNCIYFFILIFSAVSCCLALWENTCKNGGDCCSGNCDTNNGKWLTGVCKPSENGRESEVVSEAVKTKCLSLWENTCKNGSDCCSGNCDTNNGKWLTGVCKP